MLLAKLVADADVMEYSSAEAVKGRGGGGAGGGERDLGSFFSAIRKMWSAGHPL